MKYLEQDVRSGIKATAAIEIVLTQVGVPYEDETITLISTDGTSRTYTAKDSPTTASGQFLAIAGGEAAQYTHIPFEILKSLRSAIEHANGHGSKFNITGPFHGPVSQFGHSNYAQLWLEQAEGGAKGNTVITHNWGVSDSESKHIPSGFKGGGPKFPTGGHDFTGDFTIVKAKHISKQYERNVQQVPFSLHLNGPATIRGRSKPYIVSRGGDPSTVPKN